MKKYDERRKKWKKKEKQRKKKKKQNTHAKKSKAQAQAYNHKQLNVRIRRRLRRTQYTQRTQHACSQPHPSTNACRAHRVIFFPAGPSHTTYHPQGQSPFQSELRPTATSQRRQHSSFRHEPSYTPAVHPGGPATRDPHLHSNVFQRTQHSPASRTCAIVYGRRVRRAFCANNAQEATSILSLQCFSFFFYYFFFFSYWISACTYKNAAFVSIGRPWNCIAATTTTSSSSSSGGVSFLC